MEGRDKEEAPGPGGKAVSLRRSARVASNRSRSAASSVSLSVEGGGGASSVAYTHRPLPTKREL